MDPSLAGVGAWAYTDFQLFPSLSKTPSPPPISKDAAKAARTPGTTVHQSQRRKVIDRDAHVDVSRQMPTTSPSTRKNTMSSNASVSSASDRRTSASSSTSLSVRGSRDTNLGLSHLQTSGPSIHPTLEEPGQGEAATVDMVALSGNKTSRYEPPQAPRSERLSTPDLEPVDAWAFCDCCDGSIPPRFCAQCSWMIGRR
ncbi:uncharacterized protein K452DRAFT_333962 [Aplosporella prunicola CBS 121167]|uniref:Uncharacterized protein n=1 Tax=Aplosporella prunicola CBS 121167 TaxID=1176127 RepID=A0A6A6BB29_9PEZI|nr:uncharacterized protein K452DRAFT_333962 [Aplosporella prunicola CBS 121167]KAF2141300.1 hypothetical protein K452DRAFT_333962 [Aplosporella prunicola CBS 121167]